MIATTAVHGLMAEFLSADEIVRATRRARETGYRRMDAFTPYAVEGLAAELGMRRSRLPSIVLIGGIVGAVTGFWMQYYSLAIDYPVNAGGRPLNSWPVFVPIAFEVLILVAALSAFLGMLFLNRLPQPHHPVFNVPEFVRASQDRFFLCIEASDPLFDLAQTTRFLESLTPHGGIHVVSENEPGQSVGIVLTPEAPIRQTTSTLFGAGVSLVLAGAAIGGAGCQQKMAGQPSYRPLEPCEFFADGRSARPAVRGTVARGFLQADWAFFTGRKATARGPGSVPANASGVAQGKPKDAFNDSAQFITEFPLTVDERLIEHGRDRYEIYCVVCHDVLGTGHGKIVERGYTAPPSYHLARLREAPVGRLFAVVSEGYGSMPSYAGQIPVRDRWAIVAYLRALQLSQRFPAGENSMAAGEIETNIAQASPDRGRGDMRVLATGNEP